MAKSIERASGGAEPGWLSGIREVMARPGSEIIDPVLGMQIGLRESGGIGFWKGPNVDTFLKGGLDNAYKSRHSYIVPEDWISGDDFKPGVTGNSAVIPRSRVMGFTFAAIGLARQRFTQQVAKEFYGGMTDIQSHDASNYDVENLSPLSRRIWTAIAFGGPYEPGDASVHL